MLVGRLPALTLDQNEQNLFVKVRVFCVALFELPAQIAASHLQFDHSPLLERAAVKDNPLSGLPLHLMDGCSSDAMPFPC